MSRCSGEICWMKQKAKGKRQNMSDLTLFGNQNFSSALAPKGCKLSNIAQCFPIACCFFGSAWSGHWTHGSGLKLCTLKVPTCIKSFAKVCQSWIQQSSVVSTCEHGIFFLEMGNALGFDRRQGKYYTDLGGESVKSKETHLQNLLPILSFPSSSSFPLPNLGFGMVWVEHLASDISTISAYPASAGEPHIASLQKNWQSLKWEEHVTTLA